MDAQFGHNALFAFAMDANRRLSEHFERWRNELPSSVGVPTTEGLFDSVVDLTLRSGKRVRPAIAYHTALCFDHGLPKEVLLDASLSIELLQTALLIHDDIMDQDDVRRGGPTTHRELSDTTGDEHLGRSLALLAGSVAYALSDRLLVEAGLPDNRYRPANAELIRMKYEVSFGQLLDMVGGASTRTIHKYKTSSYTTMGPMRLGAAVAGVSPFRSAGLFEVGEPLGRAFQMRDDLLGVFGDAEKLGKPVGSDLRTGKQTDLVSWVMNHGSGADIEAVKAVLGVSDAPDDTIYDACVAIERSGAKKAVEGEIETLTNRAVVAAKQAGLQPAGAQFLIAIARMLVSRDR